MSKNLLTTVVTGAILAGAAAVLSLPYWTDAQGYAKASSKKGKTTIEHEYEYEYEYDENRSSASRERERDDDDDGYAGYRARAQANVNWRTECGECHLAYPPAMLPAASWQAVMGGL